MDHLDTSWCPVCDRQIVPKRIDVPVVCQTAAAPAPAVAAPPAPSTRTKSNGGRARGLVHGTGRARPALKRANSQRKESAPAPAPAAPAQPAGPVKTKQVIDQSPIPLYCSDDCRLVDLHHLDDGFAYNFHPQRHTAATAVTVPSSRGSTHDDLESPTAASDTDSSATSSSMHSHASARSYQEMDPSIAALAAIYDFPALPPPPPLLPEQAPRAVPKPAEEYVSGIMMAGRRIKETLCTEPPKRSSFSSPTARYTSNLSRDRKPIPGWTDGSDAWRTSVYSLSAPKEWSVAELKDPEARPAVYKSSVATPHRSSGVVSTLGQGPSASVANAVAAARQSRPSPDAIQELYGDYPLFNPARAEHRMRMYNASSSSLPNRAPSVCSARTTREVGILPKQAEGKLLVPNVKLRRTTSTASVSSLASLGSNGPRSPRALTRRGSGMSDDVIAEECEDAAAPSSLPTTMRAPTARTKATEQPFLYPIMLPMVRQKRVEKRTVDGVEKDVEVEVMVPKEVERLFLGPDGVSEQRLRRKQAAAAALRAQLAGTRA